MKALMRCDLSSASAPRAWQVPGRSSPSRRYRVRATTARSFVSMYQKQATILAQGLAGRSVPVVFEVTGVEHREGMPSQATLGVYSARGKMAEFGQCV